MRLNWKYFVVRTLNALVILFVIVMIVSVFLGVTYEREKKVASRVYINMEMEEHHQKLSNITLQERRDWLDKKEEEFRVGNYSNENFWWIRGKRVYSKSLLGESFEQATKVLQLKFGKTNLISVRYGEDLSKVTNDVTPVILHYLPRTILLFSTSLLICIPLSIFIGVKTATHEGKKLGKLLSILNMIGSSIPIWWAAYIGLIIFAFYLRWIDFSPLPFPRTEGLPYYWGVFKKMLFPISVIVLVKLNHIAWTTRSLVTDELQKEYVMGGRAKGLPEKIVAGKHALRNSAPPIISKSIDMVIGIIPELIIFESIIGWPGIGFLFYKALDIGGTRTLKVDPNLLVALVFFVSVVIIVLSWLADVLYGFADPRIRVNEEG